MSSLDFFHPDHSECHSLSPCARQFLAVRNGERSLITLDAGVVPATESEAYDIQDEVAASLVVIQGKVAGWKVGAASSVGVPFAAPLHEFTLFSGDTILPVGFCRYYGVEAEIVYRFGRDLLPRERFWTFDEVLEAVETVHTAIEIIDTRFEKPNSQPRLAHLADQGSHGALIIGEGQTAWHGLSPVSETVRLSLSSGHLIEHIGGNSAGDPRRLLVWLANHASARGLPLRAGDVVTTGSMTDTIFVPPGTIATAQIASLAPVAVTLP